MKENNKGSIIILTIIGIATLLVAVIGATFAYFTVNISGNPTAENTKVTSVQLGTIEFAHGNELIYENAIPGRPSHEGENAVDNIIDFSITNAVDAVVRQEYIIMLNITRDTFESDNVVYLLTQTAKGTAQTPINSEGEPIDSETLDSLDGSQYFTANNSVDHVFENGDPLHPTKLGFIPSSTSESYTEKIQIGTGTLGNFGAKDEWNFELWINETGLEQNVDQGKAIEAYITVELADASPITNEEGILPQED